jgi:tetratricopeptide (TPR) repeat protein
MTIARSLRPTTSSILTGESAHLERGLAIAERIGDAGIRVAALNNLALAYGRAREHARAIAMTETALAACREIGDRHREAALHNNLADLLRAAGRSDEAMRHLKRAVTPFAGIGEPGTMEPEVWKLVEW